VALPDAYFVQDKQSRAFCCIFDIAPTKNVISA